MLEPDHEDKCEDNLMDSTDVEIKADPELTRILEGMLGDKN